jgi:PhnB protein
MTHINAYLNFNGQCREAMTFYQQCLGGELVMQKISESPMAARVPSEMGAKILHSSLTKENLVLMGSDMMGNNIVKGNSINLCINCSSTEEIIISIIFRQVARLLSRCINLSGCNIWSSIDKFDKWMFNYSKN